MKFGFSISLRLTLWFSVIFLCGFIVFGALLLYSMNASVNSARDQKLKQRAEHLLGVIRSTHQGAVDLSKKEEDTLVPSLDGRMLQVYSLDGKILKRDKIAEARFPWPTVPEGLPELRESSTYNGQTYRVYALTASLNGVPLRVFVARVLMDNPSLLDQPALILIRFIPGMLLVSALAGYFISRRALMPVVRLMESARSITVGNLSARIPVSPVGDELARLAETCNEMLSRLEEAFRRLTQFTADASHELRSPIAFIRIASEDALHIPNLPAEAVETFKSIISETVHSSQLLEDMLLLARFDAGRAPLGFDDIFPIELVESVIDRMKVLAAQKHQHLVAQLTDEDMQSTGDAQMFRRLVWILVENAIKYTPYESVITVKLARDGQQARLTVSDNGPGIAKAHLPHLFDRFFRVDPSRGEQNGTGLGLAIAKRIAETHHAEITVQSREGSGTTFDVKFPLINPAKSITTSFRKPVTT